MTGTNDSRDHQQHDVAIDSSELLGQDVMAGVSAQRGGIPLVVETAVACFQTPAPPKSALDSRDSRDSRNRAIPSAAVKRCDRKNKPIKCATHFLRNFFSNFPLCFLSLHDIIKSSHLCFYKNFLFKIIIVILRLDYGHHKII